MDTTTIIILVAIVVALILATIIVAKRPTQRKEKVFPKTIGDIDAKEEVEIEAKEEDLEAVVEKLSSDEVPELTDIKGIGPKTQERLLNKFGSKLAVYKAPKKKLLSVVREDLADKIKDELK